MTVYKDAPLSSVTADHTTYVDALSLHDALPISTEVPTRAFSFTWLAAASVSTGVETANSLTSLIAIVRAGEETSALQAVAVTTLRLLPPSASRSIAAAVLTTPVVASTLNSAAPA